MKIIAFSDTHGYFPEIIEHCDVVAIAGDIVPLDIQNNYVESIIWFSTKFVPWCESLDCDKVIFVGGNHDFFIYNMMHDYIRNMKGIKNKYECEDVFSEIFSMKMGLPDKIIYLQDSSYEYKGKIFYGTPWIPVLKNWAFYKDSYDLSCCFCKIPDNVDLLITHSPGYNFCDTGVSLQKYEKPEYGSSEINKYILEKNIRYWICGHIHSGNHIPSKIDNTNTIVANVSIKDEFYKVAYKPLIFEI